jgi:hypothetical protein
MTEPNPYPGWDIPFAEQAPTNLPDFALAGAVPTGGLIIAGAVIPAPAPLGPLPALVYRFTNDAQLNSAPIVLILDPIRMNGVGALTTRAISSALRATHKARRQAGLL